MTPREFVDKWKLVTQSERAVVQSHFNDLCDLLGEPSPLDADPTGENYAFEKGADKLGAGNGWADVWRKNCFAWEYKGKHKDLEKALAQVRQYLGSLQNPPLMVACDIERIIVVTNWTNEVSQRHEILLEELIQQDKRDFLKKVFRGDPSLKSGETRAQLTQKVAGDFSDLARELQEQGREERDEEAQKKHALDVAHFVIRLAFCMYAEDAGLLGEKLFSRLLETASQKPEKFESLASNLFAAMSTGGEWGVDSVEFFNGGLFNDSRAFPLTRPQIERVRHAAKLDWSAIDPSILGTLFERGLDPAKRSQLGAHYTDPASIMKIVEPVILRPLKREWEAVKAEIIAVSEGKKVSPSLTKKREGLLAGFLERLRNVRVLDPACGSGNFLYMALRSLKDFELEVVNQAEELGIQRPYLQVGPEVLKGIEINVFAAELARVSIWIGELQWQLNNGQGVQKNPILRPLESIECRDALLNEDGTEAEWPEADFIIGNPPFLGDKKMLESLGSSYTTALRERFKGRVPGGADFVCFWFEKLLSRMAREPLQRGGLVSTNGIRYGKNNSVLRAQASAVKIVNAWDDEQWHDEAGAAVRVSMISFAHAQSCPEVLHLNGVAVEGITSGLVEGRKDKADLGMIKKLSGERAWSFNGVCLAGSFNVPEKTAIAWLTEPNAAGSPNSDLLRPLIRGRDLLTSFVRDWMIDTGVSMKHNEVYQYELPYAWLLKHVYPERSKNNDPVRRQQWWRSGSPRPELRAAVAGQEYVLVTPETAKHRFFRFINAEWVPDHGTIAIAYQHIHIPGTLSSKFHELWMLGTGNRLGVGNTPRYNHTRTFKTFPFPRCSTVASDEVVSRHKELDRLREAWLLPTDWTQEETLLFPATVGGPWHRLIPNADSLPPGSVAEAHYIRRVAKPGMEKILKERTLTKLYNENPAWLRKLHQDLDEAVAEAYGFPTDLSDDEILLRLLKLNHERAEEEAAQG